jgi:hypothetical protein
MFKVVFVYGVEKVPHWHRGRQRVSERESCEAVLLTVTGRVIDTARVRRFFKDSPNLKLARQNAAKKVIEGAYGHEKISATERQWIYSRYF